MNYPPQAAQGPAYQITTIDAGCCSGTIDPRSIESAANQMVASSGGVYRLHQVYIDVRSTCGPFCPARTAVLIFKRADFG
jgi:hypothetical protein